MKIIQSENGIKSITELIQNAKSYAVIVSPFNDLTGWDELKDAINEAVKKIEVEYYVRKDEGRKGLNGMDAPVFEVPMLHAKLFFSESEAIISSGNLTNRPDLNLFCRLEGDEYGAIVNFFKQYVQSGVKVLKF
jgi:hypothetical protein